MKAKTDCNTYILNVYTLLIFVQRLLFLNQHMSCMQTYSTSLIEVIIISGPFVTFNTTSSSMLNKTKKNVGFGLRMAALDSHKNHRN